MIFTTFEYAAFFLVVLLLFHLLSSLNARNWMLLVASYVFYMSWSIPFGLLLWAISSHDYWTARQIAAETDPARRKRLLLRSLCVNLGALGFFKYAMFLWANVTGVASWFSVSVGALPVDIILPVGISFFTFQSMSYTVDVYWRKMEPATRWRDYLLYVAFFPQLVAGPIVRAIDFIPQLTRKTYPSVRDIECGLAYIALGVVKKMVISDQIAAHVDIIFAAPGKYDAISLVQGVLGYAVQIYCDFSGYSDIAIGCARIMGFRFMENFRMPYASASITEFWRRWHISLSTWLRDYLYIPLGGNRLGRARTYVNLLVTMLLGGLWHGASWNFVIWGALHGAALAGHKAWLERGGDKVWTATAVQRRLKAALGWGCTATIVLAGWVFFRAQGLEDALDFLTRLLTWNTDGTRFMSPYILPAVAGVALVHLLVSKDGNWAEDIVDRPFPVKAVAYASLLILVVCLGATNAAPFIYFQF